MICFSLGLGLCRVFSSSSSFHPLMAFRVLLFPTLALPFLLLFLLQVPYYEAVAVGGAGKVIPPPKVGNGPIDCAGLCRVRCSKHSRPNVCIRACGTCCFRCKCVPPGTYGNRELCGPCYANMTTHGNKPKCP